MNYLFQGVEWNLSINNKMFTMWENWFVGTKHHPDLSFSSIFNFEEKTNYKRRLWCVLFVFFFQSYHVRDNTSSTVRTTLNHSFVVFQGLIIDIITQVMNWVLSGCFQLLFIAYLERQIQYNCWYFSVCMVEVDTIITS